MASKIAKAYAISNAKIAYVSLVNKAANKHAFLITKADDGKAKFQTCGKIIAKSDEDETHLVTGIVYEPMAEDTDGQYMTSEEIEKAAHWYMKNSGKVDVQHDFEAVDKSEACVVESWIEKSDTKIGDTPIKAGTWLMTMEIGDSDMWEKIQKGDITGFSMGGFADVSKIDDDINSEADDDDALTKSEKVSLWKRIGKALGIEKPEKITKGEVKDTYKRRSKDNNLYTAWGALEGQLSHYDYHEDAYVYESDPEKIREYLQDFNDIVESILEDDDDTLLKCVKPTQEGNTKSEKIGKAGRKMSGKNKQALAGIIQSLTDFAANFEDPVQPETDETKEEDSKGESKGTEDEKSDESKKNEDTDSSVKKSKEEIMTKAEAEKLIQSMIDKANGKTPEKVEKADTDQATAEDIQKMAEAAIEKAQKPETEKKEPEPETDPDKELVTKAEAQKMVDDAVAAVMKSRGIPTNLNNEEQEPVKKSDDDVCFLHGLL